MAEIRQRADTRLDHALERAALRDPRDFYRERLRLLKEQEPAAFDEARRYYEEVLLPRVADGESDPVLEWFEYGRRLAELGGPGEAVMIDLSGRSTEFVPPLHRDQLVLYLPEDARAPVLALNVPHHLSPAQQANYTLLIERKLRIAEVAPEH
jgi:hypothetical protein